MRVSCLVALFAALGGCADVFGFQDLKASDAGVVDAPDDVDVDAAPTDDANVPAEAEASVDAAPPCDGGTNQICSNVCVDIATSQTNCGACGHDCGGGTCMSGGCQPVVLVDNLSNPVFDIDSTSIYYSSGTKVLSCPLAGCKLQPTQLEDTQTEVYGANDPSGVMEVANGNFFYVADPIQNTIRPTLFTCPASGCVTPMSLYNSGLLGGFPGSWGKGPSTMYWMVYKELEYSTCTSEGACSSAANILAGFASQVGTAQPITADAANVYFVHPDSTALLSCPATGLCASPQTLLSGAGNYVQISVYGSKIYMVRPGQEGGIPGGAIQTCPTTGSCTPTNFITLQPYPLLVLADASGVIWFDYDPPLNGDPNQIVTCPLTGCVGGPHQLATKQSGTTMLRSDASFVYWATGSQILRVAK